jgi:hypothetical protein
MSKYAELLEHSLQMQRQFDCPARSRLEYLAESIFDFTTYDSEMAELFGSKALEVCQAISQRSTFDYIKEPADYVWFLTMCNLPFFAKRISWGTSIRGAFWDCYPKQAYFITSCGLWRGDEQILELAVASNEWSDFVKAMIDFAEQG